MNLNLSPYQVLALVGALLLVASPFLPWMTITESAGDNAVGVNLTKEAGLDKPAALEEDEEEENFSLFGGDEEQQDQASNDSAPDEPKAYVLSEANASVTVGGTHGSMSGVLLVMVGLGVAAFGALLHWTGREPLGVAVLTLPAIIVVVRAWHRVSNPTVYSDTDFVSAGPEVGIYVAVAGTAAVVLAGLAGYVAARRGGTPDVEAA